MPEAFLTTYWKQALETGTGDVWQEIRVVHDDIKVVESISQLYE